MIPTQRTDRLVHPPQTGVFQMHAAEDRADRRIVRLIRKWLSAGVLEEGKRIQSEVGTVQGGSISPLLANIYLHYVFDVWSKPYGGKSRRGVM